MFLYYRRVKTYFYLFYGIHKTRSDNKSIDENNETGEKSRNIRTWARDTGLKTRTLIGCLEIGVGKKVKEH